MMAMSDPGPPPGPGSVMSIGHKAQGVSLRLPRIHLCAYKGDLAGILQCITEGHSLQETIQLRNQHGRLVCGITPLFLAAQRGNYEVAKLLVENGANPVQPCFIQGSAELCTPGEVASLNLHLRVSRYLKAATKARRREEEVLALDDEDRVSVKSSRLSRGLERARSVRSNNNSRAPSPVQRRNSHSMAGGAGPLAAEPEAQVAAAHFMQNVDLAAFDPETGSMVHSSASKRPTPVSKLFRKLFSREGSNFSPSASHRVPTAAAAMDSAPASPMGPGAVASGASGSGHGTPAGRAMRKLDLETYDPDRPDHKKVLDRFLKDLDFGSWQPEAEGPLEMSSPNVAGTSAAAAGASTLRGPSPMRSTAPASPARSARSRA